MVQRQLGKTVRLSFQKIHEALDTPNLIEVQKKSYENFLSKGMAEVLRDVSPITDYSGNLAIEFTDFTLDKEHPKYPVEECKERDVNYAAPLRVTVRLTNRLTGEINTAPIYMGDFPLMTDNGTFIINGAERVIVSQIVRSPGVYFDTAPDKSGKRIFTGQVIPYRGAWLEYETDANDILYVRIDKTRKIPATILIRALGIGTETEIKTYFGDNPVINETIEKDGMQELADLNRTSAREEALKEIYKKLRPGEPPLVESAELLINNLFFDPKRYDLAPVGRFKYNKKLGIGLRLVGQKLSKPIISPVTGELLFPEGTVLSDEDGTAVERAGVNEAFILLPDGSEFKVFGNGTIPPETVLGYSLEEAGIRGKVRTSVLQEIIEACEGDPDAVKELCAQRRDELSPMYVTKDDIFSSINYIVGLYYNIGVTDDIDHLGNRRLRCVGELLQNQMRIGFSRMDKTIKERMTTTDSENLTPVSLINIRPIVTAIREFFGSSPLSQFMDQANPLAELTHKRRLSALGPGGLSRDRASFDVRDVHYTHYGRICPVESPEGPNIGLISSLATFARINEYGFIEAPYRRVDKSVTPHVVTDDVVYLTADQEDKYIIAAAKVQIDEQGHFVKDRIIARDKADVVEVPADRIDFVDISPRMVVSVASSMIPFLENDDNTRALMGSNMQKQAVPLITTEAPIVGTGMEYRAAKDSGVCVLAKNDGIVETVTADEIVIRRDSGEKDVYHLIKFKRSNQGTCINQRPVVNKGDLVQKDDVIADGPATCDGEISLGKNVLIGFMTWEGYNYEDAVLLNERLVRDDVYTSIHIEEYSHEARDTKLGPEEITLDIPNVGADALKDLNQNGVVRLGTEVHSGDILVGKVTPKGETELTAEERLLRAIFGEKAREVRDTSLHLPHGESGIVVDVKIFRREDGDELPPGVNEVVRVYVAQKRKISVGDKMAGRHGNKGVVSRILPPEDMPYLADGTPLDIVLNPLGVPSRMNIGQVLEVHLGYAAKKLGWKVMTPVFDGATYSDIEECLAKANIDPSGKSILYDGRTGEPFDNPVTVGIMYYLKLHHLVDDKIHARSNGPYSLITQQPLGGKAQFGGQRFGEMEVWALEAYGAAYTLQEILTVKSDDVNGRTKTYEAIVNGKNIPTPGVPEAFKVLVKELQALALDIHVLDRDGEEIDLSCLADEEPRGTYLVNSNIDWDEEEDEESMDGMRLVNGSDEEYDAQLTEVETDEDYFSEQDDSDAYNAMAESGEDSDYEN